MKLIREFKWQLRFICFFFKWLIAKIKKEDIIYLIGTPDYNNYGDQAIAYAIQDFFIQKFPHNALIEIYLNQINMHSRIFEIFLNDCLIVVIGGGFLGNLWEEGNNIICDTVQRFKNNKIIILPQTIYFTDDEKGRKCYKKTKTIFENHSNLVICLREKKSYSFVLEHYNLSNVYLIPDMVLWLKCSQGIFIRNGVSVVLRKDKESLLDKKAKDKIYIILKKYFGSENIRMFENSELGHTYIACRRYTVLKRLALFQKSKLVITDRLHGMIFAVITGTPCIAINNKSDKVSGTYEFIKNNHYIILNNNIEKLDENIKIIKKCYGKHYSFDNELCKDSFIKLERIIKEKLDYVSI